MFVRRQVVHVVSLCVSLCVVVARRSSFVVTVLRVACCVLRLASCVFRHRCCCWCSLKRTGCLSSGEVLLLLLGIFFFVVFAVIVVVVIVGSQTRVTDVWSRVFNGCVVPCPLPGVRPDHSLSLCQSCRDYLQRDCSLRMANVLEMERRIN